MQCKIHHLRAVTEAEVEPTNHRFSAEIIIFQQKIIVFQQKVIIYQAMYITQTACSLS